MESEPLTLMPPQVEFTRVFAAAHRVWNDDSKCRSLHGHNYRVTASVSGSCLNSQNFVVPFGAVKDIIDAFDHSVILDVSDPWAPALTTADLTSEEAPFYRLNLVPGVPSTEFLAQLLAQRIADAVIAAGHATYATCSLELRETDGIRAHGWADAAS